ncbi:MAG: beta-lactamase family protein [Bacteroidales bacterium]|nr:beta-lactamase family protein [Bacteroidales bacterium]MCF8338493.1 beta-lactamase family protein [Bacteroidales bacterium]
MLSRLINGTKFAAIMVLAASGHFNSSTVQSSNQADDVKDIIHKTDSILISQNKPLVKDEKEKIVKEIYSDVLTDIEHQIQKYRNQSRFNGSVAIARDGNVLFNKQYGYADMEKGIPVNDTSQFQLASVSKQFTAAAILKLYQEGRINLDSSLTTYLPELPYSDVTIRHLLTHKAGFPNYMWIIGRHWDENHTPTNEDVLEIMSENPVNLRFEPGQKFNYSNTGYCLLACVIERVSGVEYDEFLRSRFFEPLKMTNTFAFSMTDNSFTPGMVKGYRYNGNAYNSVDYNLMDGTYGDKGIYSTATDMLKWTHALKTGKIMDKALVKRAFSPSRLNNGKKLDYGYGFRIKHFNDRKMVFHNGSWSGFRSTVRTFPESGLTLVILTNNSFNETGDMARNLTRTLLNDYQSDEVYKIVKKLVFDQEQIRDEEKKKQFVDSWEYHGLNQVRQIMNRLDKDWLAHRIESFTDDKPVGEEEFYALNEE